MEHEFFSQKYELEGLSSSATTSDIEDIKARLDKAEGMSKKVLQEQYETAAKVRDLKQKMEKSYPLYEEAKEKYDKAEKALSDKIINTRTKLTGELLDDFISKSFWTEGSAVEFKWVVFPDGNTVELTSVSNSSWAKFQQGANSIIAIICAKQE